MRMTDAHLSYGPKKATNVSINRELLNEAKELGINLSAALESTLRDEVSRRKQAQWLADNADAIASYNRRVTRRGVFSDGLRKF